MDDATRMRRDERESSVWIRHCDVNRKPRDLILERYGPCPVYNVIQQRMLIIHTHSEMNEWGVERRQPISFRFADLWRVCQAI
jgi:hypothetical protein